jgi:hypothetical protein
MGGTLHGRIRAGGRSTVDAWPTQSTVTHGENEGERSSGAGGRSVIHGSEAGGGSEEKASMERRPRWVIND